MMHTFYRLIHSVLLLLALSTCTLPTLTTTSEAAQPQQVQAAPADESLFPLTITDAAGQAFTFDAPPKIGCSWYGCYEALADLGVAPHASSGGGNPADRGRTFYTPGTEPTHWIEDWQNPELWAAAEVDLIVEGGPPSPQMDALETAAPIFYLHTTWDEILPTGYQAYAENLRLLGQLTGQPAASETAIARFETALTTLRSLATPETQALTVAVLHAGEGYGATGPESPFCSVIAEVGLGTCVGAGDFTEINAEEFLALDPD